MFGCTSSSGSSMDSPASSGSRIICIVTRVPRMFSRLRRRNVPSRRPGLGIDEKAEAVRLARAGVSMRSIGRRMGVDRKAVRAAVVEAGLIVDDSAISTQRG